MQIVTWLAANGSTYQSSRPRTAADIAIADRPDDMSTGAYNRDTGEWERTYDTTTTDTDLTIGEAERLYVWANAQTDGNGSVADIILKVLGV
ncbi:ribonuclease R [Desulfovibrio legallii]|mgnify:CR=1 FL=1|uniref:Ribonuclease R n=1 Tax=Desulfovibrio legallii TaxID=571438 RepID=A0A6H3F871_9BACT|nr:ribonuclease R [Desulfovibrio legallii]TBH79519.1 ribonuclease R [Desulfovibrio legallii]